MWLTNSKAFVDLPGNTLIMDCEAQQLAQRMKPYKDAPGVAYMSRKLGP